MKPFIRAASTSAKNLENVEVEEIIVKHTADGREKKLSINITFKEGKERIMYSVEDYNGLYIMNTPDLQSALSRYGAITIPTSVTIE